MSDGNLVEDSQPAVGWHADDVSPEVIHAEHGQPTSIRRVIHRTTPASRISDNGNGNGRGAAWNEVEVQQGAHPGDRYVRHMRLSQLGEERIAQGQVLQANPEAHKARGFRQRFGRFLFGNPLATSEAAHERLTNIKALAILSSDALSSVAYATGEIVKTLAVANVVAITVYSMPIAIAIALLLLIVGFSYRQTIFAYPKGGGSYIVSKENLGQTFGLVAGAALMTDYILTVAVSISAGVAAIVSATHANESLRWIADSKVWVALIFVLIITLVNLRGTKEAGAIFTAPTYVFIATVTVIIMIGLFNVFSGNATTQPVENYTARFPEVDGAAASVSIFLVLQAFASGCSALTGVEAISDGVPAFQKPEAKNAATTLAWMIGILGFMFLGITFLAQKYNILGVNNQEQTVIDQIARQSFGDGPLYLLFVVATTLILVLAANTCYSDFPRVAYFIARDKFLPNQFSFRGDRLAYNTGIITLAIVAGLLLIIFNAETEALIPLYAIGVFLSFTLSQSGMVMKWLREKQPGWQRGAIINGIGATTTALVLAVVGITKFNSEEGEVLFTIGDFKVHEGAWIVMLLIPLTVWMFKTIRRHYDRVARELSIAQVSAAEVDLDKDIKHIAIVPISGINVASLRTIAYANSLFPKVIVVHATDDLEAAEAIKEKWNRFFSDSDVRLTILETPYRSLVRPLISFVEDVQSRYPDRALTVILPEFVAGRLWEQILHTQTAARLKLALLFHPDIIVTSVPYHIGKPTNILGAEDADRSFPLRQADQKAQDEQPAARR